MRYTWLIVLITLGVGAVCATAAHAEESFDVKLKSGKTRTMVVIKPEKKGIRIKVGPGESFIPWDQIEPVSVYAISARFLKENKGPGWAALGDYCVKNELLGEAKKCYEKAIKLDPKLEGELKEKLAKLRGEVLEGTLSLKLSKRTLASAMSTLAGKAGVKIKVDSNLADVIRRAPRDKQPEINYEKDNVTFEVAIEEILAPYKLQYMDTPEGIVVYSRKLGAGAKTVNVLTEALREGAIDDRIRSAAALGQLGAVDAVGTLCEAAKQPSPRVRLAAILSLKTFRDPVAVDTFIAGLKDPVYIIRLESLNALSSRLDTPNLALRLMECCETQTGEVPKQAAMLLGKIGTEETAETIRAALSAEKPKITDHWVKRFLIRALAEMGDAAAIPLLRKWLEHKDSAFYREAPMALALLGDRASIPSLISVMKKKEKDWSTVSECCRALVLFGGEQANTAVFVTINNQTSDRNQASLINLFRNAAPDPTVEAPIIDFLKTHEKESVQRAAAETLGFIGTEAAIPVLIEALEKKPKTWWISNPLRQLTDQNFGYDLKKWQEWWGKNKDSFKVKR